MILTYSLDILSNHPVAMTISIDCVVEVLSTCIANHDYVLVTFIIEGDFLNATY